MQTEADANVPGVYSLLARDEMIPVARKLRDNFAGVPGAPFYQREFGYYCLERWKEQGLPEDVDLADSKSAIDREVDRLFPVMRERGGYIPTCDHGVPEEVSLVNYLHCRKRCREFGE